MMEVEYRREMNRNYMVIHPVSGHNEKYTIRMLNGNKIPGLLPFQEKIINGEMKYYYDITSKQPLDRLLEHRNMSGRELCTLIGDLLYALRQLERFLLDEGQLCFEPEFIYIEPDSFQSRFCLVPGKYGDFSKAFCELSQYLLDHVNHNDEEAVVLAFSIFKECRKMNFGIDDIEECLRQNEKRVSGKGDIFFEEEQKKDIQPVTKIGVESSEFGNTPDRKMKDIILNEVPLNEAALSEKTKIGDRSNNKDKAEKEIKAREIRDKAASSSIFSVAGSHARKVTAVIIGIVAVSVPAALFFLSGINGILRWKWILLAVEIVLAAALVIDLNLHERFLNAEYDSIDENLEEEPWEVYFREERNLEDSLFADNTDIEFEKKYEEDDLKTVLLSARPIYQECRKLVPLNGGPEISISYFPFLIGKSKDIADFCLNEPGVSRLHIKIEENKEGYLITDLNSTNGTMVNGRMLDANESCVIPLGGELTIASRKFRLQ